MICWFKVKVALHLYLDSTQDLVMLHNIVQDGTCRYCHGDGDAEGCWVLSLMSLRLVQNILVSKSIFHPVQKLYRVSLVWYAVCSSCSDWLIRTCIFILGPLYVIIMGTAELQAFAGWSQRVLSLEKLTMWNCWVLKIKINWNQFISYYFNWRSRLFISSISLKLKQYSWICFVLSYFDYNFNYSYGDHKIQKNTFYGQKYKRPICYSSQLDTWT